MTMSYDSVMKMQATSPHALVIGSCGKGKNFSFLDVLLVDCKVRYEKKSICVELKQGSDGLNEDEREVFQAFQERSRKRWF